MAELSVRDIRDQLEAILVRARGDEDFGRRLNEDPEATLREAGLQSQAIGEVSGEIRIFNDGGGKSSDDPRRQLKCDYTTCWISWCNHWGTFATSGS
jgi:hypothetical protein